MVGCTCDLAISSHAHHGNRLSFLSSWWYCIWETTNAVLGLVAWLLSHLPSYYFPIQLSLGICCFHLLEDTLSLNCSQISFRTVNLESMHVEDVCGCACTWVCVATHSLIEFFMFFSMQISTKSVSCISIIILFPFTGCWTCSRVQMMLLFIVQRRTRESAP